MRNYIILNNQNSNTISGLIIQELAPISKPLQRTQVETIDGRDGDIVTPLGYAAYDKKITIGLYGDFDINEVIAYFATKGTVIFSNEPDKYYYYQIVDQIDYERLVRYRVATVTMHVQPFKYSATEGTITVDASDTVTGEGSDIALDGTAEAPFNTLRHKGNATQTTYTGKNLARLESPSTSTLGGLTYSIVDGVFNINGTTTGSSNVYFGSFQTQSGSAVMHIDVTGYTDATSGSNTAVLLQESTDGSTWSISQNVNISWASSAAKGKTLTLDSSKYYRIRIFCDSGNKYTNATCKIQLEYGSATAFEPYVGGIPSPNPDYPQDIQVLTGDSTVVICGKNSLSAPQDYTEDRDGLVFSCLNGVYNIRGNASSGNVTADHDITQPYTIREGDYWHLCNDFTDTHIQIALVFTDGNIRNYSPSVVNRIESLSAYAGKTVSKIRFYYNSGYNINGNIKPMILNGVSTATGFIPYQGQSYVIPFGDTYLAKIGDYADEPVKVDGTWYIRRAIGKVVFDGSENITLHGTVDSIIGVRLPVPNNALHNTVVLCDYFHYVPFGVYYGVDGNRTYGTITAHNSTDINTLYASSPNSAITDVAGFKTWLGTHNIIVYYVLTTPTDEEITDQDLIDALDEFYGQAHSYKGHTHITATAADGNAPAVLSVEVGEDNESTVTNAGNTTSRPILTIYGQGDIGVYINDVEVLDIALGNEQYITLDSTEMDAYKDSPANLKNRLVTGDYSKLALNAGANKIRFTGTVTKYEISKYSRWL